ncbi:MAG: nitrilase-related carbon-nitrogen hydrolase [Christensenellales bacterium]
MERQFKIALVQYQSVLGDLQKNADRAVEMVREAAAKRAKIVCFPEMFNTGYNFQLIGDGFHNCGETIDGHTITRLQKVAKECACYVIAPITLEKKVKGVFYNAAVVIDDEGVVLGDYSKHHLWAAERYYFHAGEDIPVFDTKYGKIGVMICYDAGFPETARVLTLKGAELIFMPSAWRIQDWDMWNLNIPQRALENTLYVAGVNRFGHEDDLYMFGNSKVADWRGRIIAESKEEKEEIVYAEIDLDQLTKARLDIHYLKDRRPDSYKLLSEYTEY